VAILEAERAVGRSHAVHELHMIPILSLFVDLIQDVLLLR